MEVNKKETVKEKREVIDTPPVDVKKKSSSSSKVLVKENQETDTKEQRGHYYRPYYQSELPPRLLKKLGKQRHSRENSATPKVLSDSGNDHVTSKTTSTVDKEQHIEKEIQVQYMYLQYTGHVVNYTCNLGPCLVKPHLWL